MLSLFMTPPIALYVPPTQPLVLKSTSGRQVELGAANEAVVSKLILHLAEQDAARVHVGLRDDTVVKVSILQLIANRWALPTIARPCSGPGPCLENSGKQSPP